MKAFVGNEHPTLGVEEEFHLIDAATGRLTGRADDVMAGLDDDLSRRACHELFLSVLESRSGVAGTVGQLVDDVMDARHSLGACCEGLGLKLVAAGTHPFSDPNDQVFVDSDHYRWVRDNHGIAARRMLGFGLHVHVGLVSAESALYVMDQMRRWAYPLLALSANSPIFEGVRTGLASTRTFLFNGMPRTRLPPVFETFGELEDHYEKLLAAGDVTRPGDLWWNIRPQPPLGTLEIRSMDLPTDVYRLGALAAVYQGAAATYQDEFLAGRLRPALRPEYLAQNRWRAMRDGLDAEVVEPETGQVLGMREYVTRLLDFAAAKADQLGGGEYLEFARAMLTAGSEAELQIALSDELGGDLRALELELARRTVAFTRPF